MVNFQLSVEPKTEQRLKIILNLVKDNETFARSIISYQIYELQKGILNLKLDLKEFEKKYNITSEEFYSKFLQGSLDDNDDFIIWSGIYEMFYQNKIQLEELQ